MRKSVGYMCFVPHRVGWIVRNKVVARAGGLVYRIIYGWRHFGASPLEACQETFRFPSIYAYVKSISGKCEPGGGCVILGAE